MLRKDAAEYRASVIKDELEFMKNSGGLGISQFSSTAEIKISDPLYIASLDAETIKGLVERGISTLYLAPSDRVDGYDVKIADVLTARMQEMSDNDTVRVAVVLSADKDNLYAKRQNIAVNPEYGAANFKLWLADPSREIPIVAYDENGEIYYKRIMERKEYEKLIQKYVDDVIGKTSIPDEQIIHTEGTIGNFLGVYLTQDGEYLDYMYNISAGFTADLTKAEIISLINNDEVKVIYTYIEGMDNPSKVGIPFND